MIMIHIQLFSPQHEIHLLALGPQRSAALRVEKEEETGKGEYWFQRLFIQRPL